MSRVALSLRLLWLLATMLASGEFARAENWPQWRGPRRDGTWNEADVVEKFAEKQLPLRWKAPVGPGYSGPSVAAGRVFVTDRQRTEGKSTERILCFDEQTGKQLWVVEYPCEYIKVGYEAGPRATVTVAGRESPVTFLR